MLRYIILVFVLFLDSVSYYVDALKITNKKTFFNFTEVGIHQIQKCLMLIITKLVLFLYFELFF